MNTVIGTSIDTARQLLQQGRIVGIPTETVYGLAANALNTDAVLSIFEVKNRPHFDPLIVHVHSLAEIEKYTQHIPHKALLLFQQFAPGPLTVLLPKKNIVPDLVTSGLPQVAIRIPHHPLTIQLLQSISFPLAAPSANPFGYISPTTAQHVYQQLHGKIPYILDGGSTEVGVESTIVGFENNEPVVYRLGGLSIEAIENCIGQVQMQINSAGNPKTPGSLKSHYAPKKKLEIWQLAGLEINRPQAGFIGFNQLAKGIKPENQILLSPEGNLQQAAKNLFAAMRQLDNSSVESIIAVKFPDTGLGKAINDRLLRASV